MKNPFFIKKETPIIFFCALFFSFVFFGLFGVAGSSEAQTSSANYLASQPRVKDLLLSLLKWMTSTFLILAVISFVVSGVQYVSAMGSETAVEAAKKNVTYSIIGVIAGLSGYLIVKAIQVALSASPI